MEQLLEIAQRIPKSDKWNVNGVKDIKNSLTEALESYYEIAIDKPKSFKLDLITGKIYVILEPNIETEVSQSRLPNIYGE